MEPNASLQTKKIDLADDTLEGASAIAEFLFGSRDQRRRVYYLAQKSKIPVHRLGSLLRARKSVLLDFIAAQEKRALVESEVDDALAEAGLTQ